jgi:acyl-CoA synthetase (AMP-forming)/AMP-acid ligase II/acyl carrier protein
MDGVRRSEVVLSEYSSVVELLRWRALRSRDETAFVFVSDDGRSKQALSYGELDRLARCVAAKVQSRCAPGDRALLLYPHGLDFITGFLGCLYAGVVAVPATAPRSQRNAEKLHILIDDLDTRLVLSTSLQKSAIERRVSEFALGSALEVVATDLLNNGEATWREGSLDAETLAFMQYTSGSSGNPKGVMVSHGNILHNESIIQAALGYTRESVLVSWAPLFHDMGLIASFLQPLCVGFPGILFSPTAFIQNPLKWLQLISEYRATSSGAPNFAFDHCVRMISAEQKVDLDLSSWEMAYVGSEPVRAETLERFAAAFGSCGFRGEAFYPCYGMAESTLFISGGRRLTLPRTALLGGAVVASEVDDESAVQRRVSCGFPWIDQRLLIVDPKALTVCADGLVGEIWTSGPSVAAGYWNRPEETADAFGAYLADSGDGPFLRTGDLGFISDGEVYVTGRCKDIIIIRGRNHYPQDIEQTVEESHPACCPGSGAAFSIDMDGEERVVVLQEVTRSALPTVNTAELCASVRRAVLQEHELSVHAVVLLRPFSIPKTSSGKIQRMKCRANYLAGDLRVVGQWCTDDEPIALEMMGPGSFVQAVSGKSGAGLCGSILDFFRESIARIQGLRQDELPTDRPLNTLGLNSLMMVRLTNMVKGEIGLVLSFAEIMDGMTMGGLVTAVQIHLENGGIPDSPESAVSRGTAERSFLSDVFTDGGDPAEILANLHHLSSEEKRRVLMDLLAEDGPRVS